MDLPLELVEALRGEPAHLATWDLLRPSCQREYAAWVAEAKRPETRKDRVVRVLEMARDWVREHHGEDG